MKEFKNLYFTTMYGEQRKINGNALPDPNNGPYRFVNCGIHIRLWSAMRQMYKDSEYVNTYIDRMPYIDTGEQT